MPPVEPTKHSYLRHLIWLVGLVALLAAISYVADLPGLVRKAMSPESADAIRAGTAPRPTFTEETRQQVEASTGFQALVSYTDTGFEPSSVSVHAGDTVRFSNNSSHSLSLSVDGVTKTVASRRFYESRFTTPGEFTYTSAAGESGVVEVQ